MRIEPMLATLGELPPDEANWAYEMKWDGVRAVADIGENFTLYARSGRDITGSYPELKGLADVFQGRHVVLDGEVVAFDDKGRVSFSALQPRIHGVDPNRPVAYLVFDLLHDGDESLLETPYARRRERLEALGLRGTNWQTPPIFHGAGEQALATSRAHNLEGVVAKRLDSTYEPGGRGRAWLKVKNILMQEVVIGGWRTGKDSRASTFGSLLCAVNEPDGTLRYVGRVGSGFNGETLGDLHRRLGELARREPPMTHVPDVDKRDAHWVEPLLVGEVVFAGWTDDGRLWHPRWRGLREDKDPRQVVRES